MINVTNNIIVKNNEIKERFVRASGTGGQKINKVETAVQITFGTRQSSALSNAIFMRLKLLAGRRMIKNGIIVLHASLFRSQQANRKDAQDRLMSLIRNAANPNKVRRSVKPSLKSKTRLLNLKRRRGVLKQHRIQPRMDD